MVRLSADDPDRPDEARFGKPEPKGVKHDRHQQDEFGECELCADAYARAGAERQISETGRWRSVR